MNIIVAIDKNNLIGSGINLPWKYSEDLSYFKKMTLNKVIIMGKKTFESIGHPLPNRSNFILSKSLKENIKGINVYRNLPNLLEEINKKNISQDDIFIIGGSEIFNLFLKANLIKKMYITIINKEYEGNIYFPNILSNWKIVSQTEGKTSELLFTVWEKA